MASEIQVANLALNILGSPPIISFSDDVKGARVMQLLYADCRDAVLRLHPWNFAVKRQVLAQLATAPAFGFTKAFQLPSDYLRLLRLNDGRDPYQIEADGILSDVSIAELRYIARITDTARFTSLFVLTLAAYLAAEAAFNITNSQALEERAMARFREKLQEARSVDGMENFGDVLTADTFSEARWGADELFRPVADLIP